MENFNEIWLDIPNYETNYEISNYGKVKSKINNKDIELTPINNKGYYYVNLWIKGVKKFKYIHKLVYIAFIGEIPIGHDVHHINGNKKDNRPENLIAIPRGTHTSIHNSLNKSKIILQYDLEGNLLKEWNSSMEIEKQTGLNRTNICKCCRGGLKQAYGYVWRYKKKE